MKVEHLHVNAGVELQGVDIGEERVEKIIAKASSLPSIELSPTVEILERLRQNLDFHSARLRSSRFAASQSIGCSLPAS
jgi:hypothetical protein